MKLAATSLDDGVIWEIWHKPHLKASFFEMLWSFRLQSFIPIFPIFVIGTWSWMQQQAKLCLPQLSLQKKWANTCTRGQQARRHLLQWMSEDAAVKLVCEFETAAERTHCALTTQNGTTAARLPGCPAPQALSDTLMSSHTHTHTHTHTQQETASQNHGKDLNVDWNWRPVFIWDLNSQGFGGKKVNSPENEQWNQSHIDLL